MMEVRKEKVMLRNVKTKDYVIAPMPSILSELPKDVEVLSLIGKCWYCEKFDVVSKLCGRYFSRKILKWINRPGNIEVWPICE